MIRSPSPASVRLVVPPEHEGARLDLFLAAATTLSRRAARALVAAGGVLRNGESLRVQSRSLVAGDAIDVLRAPAELGVPAAPTTPAPAILFEDAWLVVVDKPAGVLSQPAESSTAGELTIGQQLLLFLAARDGRRPFLRLVHRLDRATSGAVLFARNPETLPRLAEAWRSGQVDRRYLAVVAGDPAFDAIEVDRPIGRDPDHQWRFRVDPAGRPARTSIRVLARHAGRSALVECRLLTGRTHQVRVHLAAAGHPVIGDRLYGAPVHPGAPRPLLHAAGLELPHPKSGRRIQVESPLPADFAAYLGARSQEQPPAPPSVADSLEVDQRLLPCLPYLLQDLWALGSAVDQIVAVVGSLGLPPKSRVLDLGCGKGAVAVRLASELGLQVVGIDAMTAFLTDAIRKASEHRVSDLCDFQNLDILDFVSHEHEFDLVVLASVGGIFGSFQNTAARLRTQVRPGGFMLIDDGYLKRARRMRRKGYEHYRSHDETVAELTAFGDVLLLEASTTEASLRINDEYQRLIERRGRELMRLHPELSSDIVAYIDGQAEECRVIADHLEGAVWLLRREP